MKPNIDIESKVIQRFVDKTMQDRYLQFISKAKNRSKFINDLAHFKHFNWSLFEQVRGEIEDVIFGTLQKYKLPDNFCYVISENANLDSKIIDIKVAVNEIVGYGMGSILVFGDAEIIFYEGELMNSRYISKCVS